MNIDTCAYQIDIRGQVAENEINTLSPVRLSVDQNFLGDTRLTLRTDQSGLLGLLRYLHGIGLVFLTVKRIENR